MFQQLECNEESLALFDRKMPQFLHSVRFEMEKRFSHVKFSLFSFTLPNDTVYYYGYKKNQLSQADGILDVKGDFNESDFIEGFHKFQEAVNLFNPPHTVKFLAHHQFTQPIMNYLKKHDLGATHGGHGAYYFCVSEEQEKILMETPTPALPPGYSWGECDPNDAEYITDFWMYAPPGEAPNTREKLKVFPSVCIYYEGKPVAFELIDISGSLNHQFVLKEHRGKGLGAAIEVEISKKCIREGIIVHKNVDVVKPSILDATRKCRYWTTPKNPDGTDLLMDYLLIRPKENQ